MSNSPLVTYTRISPNRTDMSNKKNTHIVIHHMAGILTVEQCGSVFSSSSRQASSNYGVDGYGHVGLYVDESDRSWATANREIDSKAVTIEVSNDEVGGDWHVSDTALKKTIELCADICKRNGIKELRFTGDKSGNLHMHQWYANTACPGPYLGSKFKYIATEVNKILNGSTPSPEPTTLYRVQTGAFKNKENADRQLAKVKAAGFETYMVKVDGLYKIQVGAYRDRRNAEIMLNELERRGFDGFITTKSGTPVSPNKKSNEEIAQEVIEGKWGNDPERSIKLKAAGYDPEEIQEIVNRMM